MRARKLLVLGLVVILALGTLAVAGCGGDDEEAKAALRTALQTVETKVTGLQTAFTSGGTVADLKAAKDDLATDWQAVVTAAEKVKGTDVEAAKKAWTDLDTAVSGVPDSATLIEAATQIMTPVQSLMTIAGDLAELAGEAEE
ncbi:MAG: hypothetical protein JXA87_05640 [Thermoleophilia bacterium]|nr:hypothetical protein [Thermoleophilia bacterium]